MATLETSSEATPKTIMRLMGIPGLTLYHLKSHLQKYRLSKNLQSQANASRAQGVLGCSTTEIDKPCEGNGSPASHLDLETQTNSSSMHINEALQMQIEVQRRLHEQLEVQRHLQLRIEAQGKYLQSVLEKAQEALGTIAVAETAATANASSSKRLQNEHTQLHHHQQQQQVGDGSVDSCLTACDCEGSHHSRSHGHRGEQDILSIGLPPFEPAAARSGKEHHYLLFPNEPSRRRSCSDERRREMSTLQASELDLSINGRSSSHSHRRENIDLNGAGWS
jgi:SHAQKYF class myb-like DNA-binding protein